MKILSAEQIRAVDAYTIAHQPIPSLELMERAALAFTNWFKSRYAYQNTSIHIFCGTGNNGGDGLAIGRLLHHQYYLVHLYICKIGKHTSEDFEKNRQRLPRHNAIQITTLEKDDPLPDLPTDAIIIDGLFGSGLNRPIEGYWATLIQHLNTIDAQAKIAIDIPSGLYADRHSEGIHFQAHRTFSFELPKLAFLFPENFRAVGQFDFASIGLMTSYIETLETSNYYLDDRLMKRFLKRRNKFDHKGTFGHVLLIAGSYGMLGAALLASKAAMRSGAGLVSLHLPKIGYAIVQSSLPEVMVQLDQDEHFISEIKVTKNYAALGIGPGIGTQESTVQALRHLLEQTTSALVLDADALNIIAKHPALLKAIPKNSILTPHPKEFERLFGTTENDFERNALQRTKAVELGVFVLLKGAHSCVATPDGLCYFNATGNPGMATAGSGDVLTGIITSLLGQGYTSKEAVLLGVYVHGLAGDLMVEHLGSGIALMAGDLVEGLGLAFGRLEG